MPSSPPRASELELALENATVRPREPHCELLDTATREIWLVREPVPREWFDALVPAPPLVKSGYGTGAMDRAWFRRSPGAPADGPLATREIGGRVFQLVAKPDLSGVRGDFPRRLVVDKHHVIGFDAGRLVMLLRAPDGREYVELVCGRGAPSLPAGWSLHTLELAAPWEIELPAPTETWWLANGASFQGPIDGGTAARLP
jgi:hypothetical protein